MSDEYQESRRGLPTVLDKVRQSDDVEKLNFNETRRNKFADGTISSQLE